MTRIQPEYFIEVYCNKPKIVIPRSTKYTTAICIKNIDDCLKFTQSTSTLHTLAIFLIKPQTTTLEERLINRAIVRQNAKI